MAITWKDDLAALIAVGVIALAVAKHAGWQHWLTAPRIGIAVLAIAGIIMCAQGSAAPGSSPWQWFMSSLGVLALLFIVVGLITGSTWAFYAVAANILAMWLLATMKHVLV